MTARLSVPKTITPKTTRTPDPANRICTSPNARATPFGERILRRPRPANLTPEDVVIHALRCWSHLRHVAMLYGHVEADLSGKMDVALDVAARIVETRTHEKYDPERSSVDSWLAGAARNIFRKRREVASRRAAIMAARVAPQEEARIRAGGAPQSDAPGPDEPSLWDISSRVRARVTPTEAEVLDLALRVGPDPARIAHATGWDVPRVREALRGVRAAAGFLGLGQAPRPCF